MQDIEAKYFHVDAFADKPFSGNPASVCFMPTTLDEQTYFSIAREMNIVSEMSIVEEAKEGCFKIRWFSQQKEVPLCGHATLATAHVIFNHMDYKGSRIEFQSQSGSLYARKTPQGIQLDFPENKPHRVDPPYEALNGLGVTEWVDIQYSPGNQKLMVHLEDYETLKSVNPDFEEVVAAENSYGWRAIMVTSPGFDDYDFVSRHFAPLVGVNEDPVTGSNHTMLAPYWGEILGKKRMKAYQASRRGGALYVELADNRVLITGRSVTIMEGNLRI